MSGGAYNYLHQVWDIEDMVNKRADLERMADRLNGLPEVEFPGATAAALLTRQLLARLTVWQAHIDAQLVVLGPVWKSVEWWDSADSGPDGVVDALAKMLNGDEA